MKLAFLCPSLSRTGGGIFEIERNLAQALARQPHISVELFGPSDAYTASDLPAWLPLQPRQFPYSGPSSFRYSRALAHAFVAADADLAHLHALWMHNSIVIGKWAKRWNRPYVITVNGMLDQWALKNSGWKKRIASALYERDCLKGAACIQVNSVAECRAVRLFGLTNPICIIPNGVDLPESNGQEAEDEELESPWKKLIPTGRRTLLYLGRLHPKKGLVNLLRAWSQTNDVKNGQPEWTLAIAGWDQVGHENDLRKLASNLGLNSSVVFLGPQFGEAKSACYRNCDAFILPSFSEGLPIAVLEAWSHGKPVLMTTECNLQEGFSANAALRIHPDAHSIVAGLRQLAEMSTSDRKTMGDRGLAVVKSSFTWPKIAAEMRSVYAWVLGSGPKPACVFE